MRDLTVRIEDIDSKSPYLSKLPYFFVDLLRRKYNVNILTDGDEQPDILFYSCWGMQNFRWRHCIRIYFTAEQDIPDFNLCDYAVGLAHIGMPGRFLHFPFYVFYNDILHKLEKRRTDIDEQHALKRDFCSTVISGPMRHPIYFEILNKLNEYKTVASGGRRNNNVGGPVTDKLAFISKYKFNLAIENLNTDGYITEKILEAFVAGTVPIYWGGEQVKKDFGEGGYINISDFETLDEAIEYIKKVDNDDELYMKILHTGAQPAYTYDEWCECLFGFLDNAIEHGKMIYDSGIYNVIFNEREWFYRIRNSIIGRAYRKYQRTRSTLDEYRNRHK